MKILNNKIQIFEPNEKRNESEKQLLEERLRLPFGCKMKFINC